MTYPALHSRDFAASLPNATVTVGMGEAIDGQSLEGLRGHLRKIPIAPRRLSIDCGPVRSVDPVGAALLWLLCLETERSTGMRINLIDLPRVLVQRLRNHPLLEYVGGGDDIFADPFASNQPSAR